MADTTTATETDLKLALLREEIIPRLESAISDLYEMSVRSESDTNALRLTEKFTTLETVVEEYGDLLTSEELTIEAARAIANELVNRSTGLSIGKQGGFSLASNYIDSYIR